MLVYLIAIASYVLYALGLYTIAERRGIRHAWLAWIPVASVWTLGSIADDYRTRHTGRRHNMRVWLTALYAASVVLVLVLLISTFAMLFNVFTVDEITDIYLSSAGMEGDLYAMSQEEMAEQLTEKIEARMTDEMVERILVQSLMILAVSLVTVGVNIAVYVLEMICLYRLLNSCDPRNAVLFFVIGIVSSMLMNLFPVFVYLCRNKDLGLTPPPPPVMGYIPPSQDQPGW